VGFIEINKGDHRDRPRDVALYIHQHFCEVIGESAGLTIGGVQVSPRPKIFKGGIAFNNYREPFYVARFTEPGRVPSSSAPLF
jgi:hypothetical protein